MKAGIFMEPLSRVKKHINSSYALVREGFLRGHEIYWLNPLDYGYDGTTVRVVSQRIESIDATDHTLSKTTSLDVNTLDLLIFRVDPPIDHNYLTLTYLLSRLDHPVILSAWNALRDIPEKLLSLELEKYMPKFIVSAQNAMIQEFTKVHKTVVLKPFYDFQGKGVVKMSYDDPNLNAVLDYMIEKYKNPIIAQEYCPEVKDGITRIILIESKPVGGINIKPGEGDFKAYTGGEEKPAQPTNRQNEICQIIARFLNENGIFMAGIDFIQDRLLEVNITSPGCVARMHHVCGINVAAKYWTAAEKRVNQKL